MGTILFFPYFGNIILKSDKYLRINTLFNCEKTNNKKTLNPFYLNLINQLCNRVLFNVDL